MVLFGCLGAVIVMGVVVVWGVPMHLVLRHFKKTGMFWYALIGAVPSLAIPIDSISGNYVEGAVLGSTLFFTLVGVSAALAFRYVVFLQNN